VSTANDLDQKLIAERCKGDEDYLALINRLVRSTSFCPYDHLFCCQLLTRISNYRGCLKKITAPKVEGFYQLVESDQCAIRVKELTSELGYIYPTVCLHPQFKGLCLRLILH